MIWLRAVEMCIRDSDEGVWRGKLVKCGRKNIVKSVHDMCIQWDVDMNDLFVAAQLPFIPIDAVIGSDCHSACRQPDV